MAGEFPELTFDETEDFTADRLNQAMSTLDARLRAQEALRITYEGAVDQLNRYGLVRLNDAMQPVYDRLMTIGRIGVIFQVICSTPNRLGVGQKTFIIPPERRLTFAPAAYLQITSTGDGGKSLYGLTQSYNEVTGELIVSVDQVRGIDEGVISSWTISAAGTPVVFNNANDLGVYTQEQSDAKIAQAINNLRGGAPDDRATLGAINQALSALTDGAVNIRNFAQASTAINNRLQVDKAQGLNTTAKAQALDNLGVSDFIKSLLSQPTFDAARSYLGIAAATPVDLGSRVNKTGDTMTGDLFITKNYANVTLTYPNVRSWMLQAREDGSLYHWDNSQGVARFAVRPDGSLWCAQLGDINSRIEDRASAHANAVGNGKINAGGTRFVYAGDLGNDWNYTGGFQSPYGGYACVVDRATNPQPGFGGQFINVLRWRYFQTFSNNTGWITTGAAS